MVFEGAFNKLMEDVQWVCTRTWVGETVYMVVVDYGMGMYMGDPSLNLITATPVLADHKYLHMGSEL